MVADETVVDDGVDNNEETLNEMAFEDFGEMRSEE